MRRGSLGKVLESVASAVSIGRQHSSSRASSIGIKSISNSSTQLHYAGTATNNIQKKQNQYTMGQ